jgi:hypothetical protein
MCTSGVTSDLSSPRRLVVRFSSDPACRIRRASEHPRRRRFPVDNPLEPRDGTRYCKYQRQRTHVRQGPCPCMYFGRLAGCAIEPARRSCTKSLKAPRNQDADAKTPEAWSWKSHAIPSSLLISSTHSSLLSQITKCNEAFRNVRKSIARGAPSGLHMARPRTSA